MKMLTEMTDDEREQYIRDDNSRRNSANPCGCDWCFILRLLDAERARADAAENKVAAALDLHQPHEAPYDCEECMDSAPCPTVQVLTDPYQ